MTARLRTLPTLALGLLALTLAGCGPDNLVNGVQNPLSYGLCGLLIVVLDVLALVDVWKSGRSDGDKVLWTIAIVVFPFVGLLAYYVFGKR